MSSLLAVCVCIFAVVCDCADQTWIFSDETLTSSSLSIKRNITVPDASRDYILSFSVDILPSPNNNMPTCDFSFGNFPALRTNSQSGLQSFSESNISWDTSSQGPVIEITMGCVGGHHIHAQCTFSNLRVNGTSVTNEPTEQPTDLPTKQPTNNPTAMPSTTAPSTGTPSTTTSTTSASTTVSLSTTTTTTTTIAAISTDVSTTSTSTTTTSTTEVQLDTSQTMSSASSASTASDTDIMAEEEDYADDEDTDEDQEEEEEEDSGNEADAHSSSAVPYMQFIVAILGGIFCLIAIGIALALKRAHSDFSGKHNGGNDASGDEEEQLAYAPGAAAAGGGYNAKIARSMPMPMSNSTYPMSHSTNTNVVANALPSSLSPFSSPMFQPGEAVDGVDPDGRMPAMLEMQMMNLSKSMTQIEGEQLQAHGNGTANVQRRTSKHANAQINGNARSAEFGHELAMMNKVWSENDRVLQRQQQKHVHVHDADEDEDSKMMQEIEHQFDGYQAETRLSVPSMIARPHGTSLSASVDTPGMEVTKGGDGGVELDNTALLHMGTCSFVVSADDSDDEQDEQELEKMLHEVNSE